jgi:hypothetical protein
MADKGTMQDHIEDLMLEAAELHGAIRSLRESIALLNRGMDCWKRCAEAYERGDLAMGDKLFSEALRNHG